MTHVDAPRSSHFLAFVLPPPTLELSLVISPCPVDFINTRKNFSSLSRHSSASRNHGKVLDVHFHFYFTFHSQGRLTLAKLRDALALAAPRHAETHFAL